MGFTNLNLVNPTLTGDLSARFQITMANYYASARSNKFKVRDIEIFKSILPDGIEVDVEDESDKLVMIYMDDPDRCGWPCFKWNEEAKESEEWDIKEAIAPHLQDDEWCVIQEVGAEKLRYLVGYSVAFNNKGERYSVNINDVYKHLPDNVSDCTY